MLTPLADNPSHVRALCSRLNLGSPMPGLRPVSGGFHHRMWSLETPKGRFAVKQLAPDVDLHNKATVQHFNATEATAEAFASQGIPAVYACSRDSVYLQVLDDVGYLVHPWRDARGIPISRVSKRHALKVAEILARMHSLDLKVSLPPDHSFDIPLEENIELLVDFAQGFHIELADILKRALPGFREIARAQTDAIAILDRHRVVSHGDMDQKNVLWEGEKQAWLIDWESARRLNPGYEALRQALNWSGIVGRFVPDVFSEFLDAYTQAGGRIESDQLGAAYQCVLGDWLNWLMYNVGRCMDMQEPEQRTAGQQQVSLALATLQHVMDHVPGLLGIPDPLAIGVD